MAKPSKSKNSTDKALYNGSNTSEEDHIIEEEDEEDLQIVTKTADSDDNNSGRDKWPSKNKDSRNDEKEKENEEISSLTLTQKTAKFRANLQCCKNCPKQLEEKLKKCEGVQSVVADKKNDLVTVTGTHFDPIALVLHVKNKRLIPIIEGYRQEKGEPLSVHKKSGGEIVQDLHE